MDGDMKIRYIGSSTGHSGLEVYSKKLLESLEEKIEVEQIEPSHRTGIIFLDHLFFNSRKIKGDIAHVTNQDLFSGFSIPSEGKKIVTVHDIFPYTHDYSGPFYSYMASRYVKNLEENADAVIAVSEATKEQLIENTSVKEEKVYIVREGVDRERYRPMEDDIEHSPYLLHVGSELNRKNIGALYRIFSEVKEERPNLKLVRVSEKTQKGVEAAEKAGLKIGKDLVYESNVTEERLVKLYSNAEKMIYPSHLEGFGRPIVEALSCGTPVVAYDRKPMSELLPGDMLVEYEDESKFVDRILELESNPQECRDLTENMTWEKTADKTIEVYEDV